MVKVHAPSLADSIDVLLSSCSSHNLDALFPLKSINRVKSFAAYLPAILRGGLECRLTTESSQVDLQQCILPNRTELELLQSHLNQLKATDTIDANPVWTGLQHFVSAWGSSLTPIQEIWLEFDVPDSVSHLPIPCLFFGLQQYTSSQTNVELVHKAIALLLCQSAAQPWQEMLERCFDVCSDDVFISHIGIMLSRQQPVLRVNIKRLQANTWFEYLKRVGWSGNVIEAQALINQCFDIADRITVCIDIGAEVFPQISFECIFLGQTNDNPGWTRLLDLLVEQGLCLAHTRDALFAWPATINPANTKQQWPAHLVTESLLKSNNYFSCFQRALSHIKISCKPQNQLDAKAYLWFEHRWLNGEKNK